ncbi:MAG: hypothetical protein RXO24_09685 [Acidilobus sp.]
MDQYVLPHLVADEVATTAAEAPLISGALLSVVLGLLAESLFPLQMAERARVTSVEAVLGSLLAVLGLLAESLFPLQMAERAEMKEVERGKVVLGLLG